MSGYRCERLAQARLSAASKLYFWRIKFCTFVTPKLRVHSMYSQATKNSQFELRMLQI